MFTGVFFLRAAPIAGAGRKENTLQVLTNAGPIARLPTAPRTDGVEIGSREAVTENFAQKVKGCGRTLHKQKLRVLQVNMGKYCNQACLHCHVEAGPGRKEIMARATVEDVLRFLDGSDIPTVDITGGAPELNPHFDYLVESCKEMGRHVMDRCNLTVFYEEGKGYLPEFFRRHRVEVICSLPCYTQDNVDSQRGDGAFDLSIRGLQDLNRLGYGAPDSGLELHLMYNPVGNYLPPPQEQLEGDYRRMLGDNFGIVFNRLYCLTNVPITRFRKFLVQRGEYDDYLKLLEDNFNPDTVDKVMCRDLLSVGWDGAVYDCDFNQMLEMSLGRVNGRKPHIREFSAADFEERPILTGDHCFACTAGTGSSCGGALV